MSQVYLAVDETGSRVALKIPKLFHAQTRQRFDREAAILRRLDHPHIVKLIDFGQAEGKMYIAEQYIDGCGLQELLAAKKDIEPDTAVAIIRQIADALQYAYDHDVLYHRDIKPSNILMDRQGTVYLTDFGIAKAFKDPSLTQDRQVLGTPHYCSPEQALGATLDWRTDLYSLGIVLYEILTGEVPFDGTSSWEAILYKHISQPPPSLCDKMPDVSPDLEVVVNRCLEKDPARRFQSIKDLLIALPANETQNDLAALVSHLTTS
jgi:serine/threonine-protein kinase